MILGIFHPHLNGCGGSVWVALKIIQTLKEHGHQLILLTDSKLNSTKFANIFNEKINVDKQIIFPLRFFPPQDFHNIYTDAIRSKLLKSKCEILIDTYSNSLLPGMDVAYIHYPIMESLNEFPGLRNKIFYYPHKTFLSYSHKNNTEKLIFANSKFTAEAIKNSLNLTSHVLYPPVILNQSRKEFNPKREDTVLTISRIAFDKNLEIIPHVAKYSKKGTSFIITGLYDHAKPFKSLQVLIKNLGVADKVKIIPNISRTRLNDLLFNCKVYFHTKINEHFGISIIEAMSSGCIPIVHNSGGPKEFVSSNLRYETIEEAAMKIDAAIENWSVTKAYRLSQTTQKFSESNFCKRFTEIFNKHCT